MTGTLLPYNIALPAASGLWIYSPFRDGPAAGVRTISSDTVTLSSATRSEGWNASFSGNDTWPHWPNDDTTGSGNMFFRTQSAPAKIELDFTGTGLVLCITPNGATYTLSVDGQISRDTDAKDDTACVNYGSEATIIANNLELGRHKAELSIVTPSAEPEFRFWGGSVMTSVAVASSSEKVSERMIDDIDPEWLMLPGRGSNKWDASTNSSNYEQTSSFNCVYGPDETASYTFQGASAIVLYGGLYEDTHDYSVVFDGRTTNLDASASGWAAGSVPIFIESNLDPSTQHTITLRNYNENNPNCLENGPKIKGYRGCCVNLDALRLIGLAAPFRSVSSELDPSTTSAITQAIETLPLGPSSASSGSQPPQANATTIGPGVIAGGVIGGMCGGFAIAATVFFVIRCRRAAIRPYRCQPPRAPASSQENLKSSRYFMLEKGSSKAGSGDPLRHVDMEGMVEYAAGQFNRGARPGGSVISDSLPSYRC